MIAPSREAATIHLLSPEPGAVNVPTKNLVFSWNLTAKTDSFDWVLDNNSDFSSPVESKTGLTSKTYECTKTLDYDTTYYWGVYAYKGGSGIARSAISTFTTIAEGMCPALQEGR